MSFARLKVELLAARDAREGLLAALLNGATGPLVMASSAIPGPDKTPPGSAALFAWGVRQLRDRLDGCRVVADGADALGPYCLMAAAGDPLQAKAVALAIEAAIPAARLLDLDVYAVGGARIGRAELGEPARRCLLCAEPASDCIRLNRHPMERLLDPVGQLLAPFAAGFTGPLADPLAERDPGQGCGSGRREL